MLQCLDDQVVLDLVSGGLLGQALAAAEHHLASCLDCGELVTAAAEALEAQASPTTFARVSRKDRLPRHSDAIPGYELLRQLGGGGMGVIFEARRRATGARVALKTVRPRVRGAASAIRREIANPRPVPTPGLVV